MYLEEFKFPEYEVEASFRMDIKRTCYDTYYPFGVLSRNSLERLEFEPVTILYGGNGSGKTTALNVIAEKLSINRNSLYNRSNFFEDYLNYCEAKKNRIPEQNHIITSDDVFDYMLDIRALNEGIHKQRDVLFDEYLDAKYSKFKMSSLDDYEELKKVNAARSNTQSKFVRKRLMDNVREYSNGESAFLYFTERLKENGLYLLDEPENSLSPKRQLELAQYLEDSARFFGCQLIIATHSPFLLAIKHARIYDLDTDPVEVKDWTKLSNVREYYEFFKKHEKNFNETQE